MKIFATTETQNDIQFSAISYTGASATTGVRNFLAALYTHFNGVSSYWSIKSGTASTTSATGDGGFIIKNTAGVEVCFANGYDIGATMKTNKCPNVFGDTVGTYGAGGTRTQNDVHFAMAAGGGVSAITDRTTQIASATRFSGWTRAGGGSYGGLEVLSSYAYAKIVETPNYVFIRKQYVSGDNKYYRSGCFAGQLEAQGNNATGNFIACSKFNTWTNSGGTLYPAYHMRYESSSNGHWIACMANPAATSTGFVNHATYTRNQNPGNDGAGSPTYNFYKLAIFDTAYESSDPSDYTFVGYVPCILVGQEGNCNPNEAGGLTSLNYDGSTFARCFGYNDQSCWFVRDDGSVTENP